MLENINDKFFGKTLLMNCPENKIKLADLKKAGINIKTLIEVRRSSRALDQRKYWMGMFGLLQIFPEFWEWESCAFYIFNKEAEDGFISLKFADYTPVFITTSKNIFAEIRADHLLAVELSKAQYELEKLARDFPDFLSSNQIKVSENLQSQVNKLLAIKNFGSNERKKAVNKIEKIVFNGW
jgi:hypothetical protein